MSNFPKKMTHHSVVLYPSVGISKYPNTQNITTESTPTQRLVSRAVKFIFYEKDGIFNVNLT